MSDEKETSAKGPLLVNRGKAAFHIKPLPKVGKDGQLEQQGEEITVQPGEAFHAHNDEEAEKLLNYHAIGEGSEEDPRIQSEIEHHEAEIKRLKEEQAAQKKPPVKEDEEKTKKETATERENRKRSHRHR